MYPSVNWKPERKKKHLSAQQTLTANRMKKKRRRNTKNRTKKTPFKLLPCKLLCLYAVAAVADIALQ